MKNYFTEEETSCNCGCGENNVSEAFLHKLNRTRIMAKIPFIPTSFCRCKTHNKKEGGEEDSEHISDTESDVRCEAIDIKAKTSREKYLIVSAAMLAGFTRIGIAKTFIHLGNSDSKAQEVVWTY